MGPVEPRAAPAAAQPPAVEAGAVPAEFCVDTGWSIRSLSALCGLAGPHLNPDQVMPSDVVSLASSTDDAGSIAMWVKACRVLFDAFGVRDGSSALRPDRAAEPITRGGRRLRVGRAPFAGLAETAHEAERT
ncbi:MAG TPA: hypothetical protein VF058_04285 [Actinomycetota bacterium]